jgi:hypothetical protein
MLNAPSPLLASQTVTRSWWATLAALAAVRVAIPLVDWATGLPGVPRFHYHGLQGDATGFYAATREFIAAWGRVPRVGLVLLALAAAGAIAAIVLRWRRRPSERPWLLALGVLVFGLVVCVDVVEQNPSGAAVFGWPLVWALPMLPYRALGGHLDWHVAFGIGLVLSLCAVAATVIATAYAGLYATGRRSLGLLAAAFFTFWPFITGVVAGHRAWANDQWSVETGLHMYTEPLSTALVAGGLALALAPRLSPMRLSVAGVLLSVATCVKLSNGLLAALGLGVVVWRVGLRRALPYVAGMLSFAPVVIAYWPLSYPKLFGNRHSWPQDPFDPAHVVSAWTHSSLFTPHALALLVPLALVGAFGLRRPYALVLVLAWLLVNPVFYSFYANTPKHPRFLYASLPALFVLWAAGIGVLAALVPQLRGRAAAGAARP